jgi:hypothetical protein
MKPGGEKKEALVLPFKTTAPLMNATFAKDQRLYSLS